MGLLGPCTPATPREEELRVPGAAGLLVPLLCTTLAANMRVQAWQESSSWADIEPSL